ncbi:discoidin domain-containing protein [Paenibacillus sp. FSL R10-2734]|uniref:discoidin domain-containing protein n=1 Tax=Paenibacillus sp. FSL R10-2734 TaxID=2954691 RepID=UPI0030D7621E
MITTVRRRLSMSFLSVSLIVPMFMGLTGEKVSAANASIKLDPNHMQKPWEGWGTSLAWFGNITGGWNDKVKDALADSLYSPEGLNFNIARYNIGGGENPSYNTMRQGGEIPGFSPSPGVFDWTQDANQRWWLQAAKERGANILEAFSNSAPYYMTESGSTTGHWDSGKDNLKWDEYDNFADYLTEVVKHFKNDWDIDFNYLSPVNEPSTNYWGFGGGQEGSHWDVGSQMKIINTTRAKLDKANLQSVEIAAMDESILDTFVRNWNSYDETTKANVGKMNTHSYGGSKRAEIRDAAKAADKPLWMSEVDLGPSGIAHDHDDFEPALALAERIMTDITWLEPTAWITWQAIESEKNMQKDKENMNWGLLHADFDTQEWWYTKKYYAMQQFSKFIPQGASFIGDTDDNTLAAYDPNTNKIHVVYRNPNITSQNISLDLSQFDTVTGDATPYVSSATENVVQKTKVPVLDNMLQTTVGAKSITTFVIEGASFTGDSVIPQNDMKVTASSAQSGEAAERSLDGDQWTNWHTSWDPKAKGPHSITYDLGAEYDVNKLSYLPRQDKDWNGIITKFTIEVSSDGTVFTPVAQGTWNNDKSEKTATFTSQKARFVKLKVDESNASGSEFASAAEINIMRKSNFTVDTTLLANAISRAENYISANNANVSDLQDLVNEAKVVQANTLATQEEITQILYKLNVEYSVLGQGLIPQSQMSATSDNSASEDGPAKTIDGDIWSKWHTAYNNDYSTLPHSITYNLGKAYNGIYKLQYLPRQDADWNGVVTKFEVSVSDDGTDFTKVVAEGTWNADKTEKTATFNAQGAKYVRFTALESRSDAGKQYASAAEINIFNKQGYKVDFSSLDSAIQAAEKFKTDSEKDESYFKNLDAILIQAATLLKSASATQEEIAKLSSRILIEISNIQNSDPNIKGMSLFYTPEAYHGNPANLMVDNDIYTYFESNWDKNGRKYKSGDYIVVDLGESIRDVGKVLVTPRQDKANGRINQFKIYYSDANLKDLPADGTQAYLDKNFKFAANGSFEANSTSVQSATFKSVEARYIAIQAITTGGDGNTLSTAEIAVSQKQTATFDTSSLQDAIDQLRTLSSISPKVKDAIEKQITTIGNLSDLTEESISYYTRHVKDLYNLYLTVNNRSSIKSGEVWLDTEGVPIQAHGGGILYNEKNKTYYWYGEDKTEGYLPTGVHAYSSKDLYTWQNEGIVLPVFNNPQLGEDEVPDDEIEKLPLYLDENSETYKNSGVPYDPDRKVIITSKDEDYTGNMKAPNNTLSKHNSPERIAELNALYANYSNEKKQGMYKDFNWDKVVERPKVVYNKKNNNYVMWWHQDGPIAGEYWTAEGGVAVSDSPTGPFKYLSTSRLPNVGEEHGNEGMLRDMTLYVDDDGNEATHDKAYLVYSSEENATTIIMMLNDDYTGPAQNEKGESLEGTHYVRAFKDWREAPTIFKQDGVYYMITSGLSGWDPNEAQYRVSTEGMFGPWENKGNPMVNDSRDTFRSQSTFVLPYRDGNGTLVPNKFIFMADRWYPNNLSDSRYVWLPLELDNENRRVAISWHDEWKTSQLNTGTTINFNSNGGSSISSLYGAEVGTKITAPAEPTREGFKFENWYKDEALKNVWDFTIDTVPTNDITLYAKWVPVAAPVITNIMPVNVATVTGTPPVLPTVVTAVYSDGTTQDKSVVWDLIDPSEYAEARSFSVSGVVDGTVIPAIANVIVSDDVYRAQLAARIADAQAIHDLAVEGTAAGQYPIGSKQELLASILEAQQTVDNNSTTQQELEQATNNLNSALQVFEASKNQHVKVQSISITSTSSSIDVKKGTLQLQAEILPVDATNKSVTWAVYGADGIAPTDTAIINTNGLLTAVKNGVVKVVATSVDNTTVYGTKEITISGQNDSPEPTPDPGTNPGTNPGNPTTPTNPTPTPTTPPTKEDPHRYVPTGKELQSETTQNGTTSLTINIDKEALTKKLELLNKTTGTPNLDIEIPGVNSRNAVNLPLDVLYNSLKANKDTIITLSSHLGRYELPLSNLNREELEKAAKVAGATLIIRMDNMTSQHEQKFEQSIVEKGMKRVSDIIAYKVILKSDDKEEELQRFGNMFMTRVINMDGVIQDPSSATAVIFDPITGQMRFVPSVFNVKNGKTEVSIFGQANSLYAIVQNKKTFDDMIGHWAQKDVETLASKLIINGMTDQAFAPAGQVTRAQFAALLVRGLGLSTESVTNMFADVSATAWYSQDVNTAAKLGLIKGVGEGKFSPDARITREQMVVMIMNAVGLVQGDHKEESQTHTPFADQNRISDYAAQAVTEAVSKGLIKGKTGTTFAPQDAATRAEAAVMIKQILQYLKFLN